MAAPSVTLTCRDPKDMYLRDVFKVTVECQVKALSIWRFWTSLDYFSHFGDTAQAPQWPMSNEISEFSKVLIVPWPIQSL